MKNLNEDPSLCLTLEHLDEVVINGRECIVKESINDEIWLTTKDSRKEEYEAAVRGQSWYVAVADYPKYIQHARIGDSTAAKMTRDQLREGVVAGNIQFY